MYQAVAKKVGGQPPLFSVFLFIWKTNGYNSVARLAQQDVGNLPDFKTLLLSPM